MKRVVIGKIEKIYGLQGEVKILPLTFNKERFSSLSRVYLDSEEDIHIEFDSISLETKHIRAKLKGVSTPQEARKYLGFFIYINKEDVQQTGNDEVFFYQLKDFSIMAEGKILAKVKEILEDGKTSVFITFDYDNKEYIVPFIDDFIDEINKEKQYISIKHFRELTGNAL